MMQISRMSFLGGLLLAPVIYAAEPADVTLDDNVTWTASAQAPVVPEGIDTSAYDVDAEPEGELTVELYRLEYLIGESSVAKSMTTVYKYLSEDSVRDYGNMSVYFDSASDAVDIRHALVIDSEGNRHLTEPATVQILPTDTFDIFSDGRYALLPLAGLDVGSRAVISHTNVTDLSGAVAPWGSMPSIQFGVPMERLEIVLRWESAELKPDWHVDLDNVDCVESDASVTCTALDIPAYPTDSDVYYDDILPRFHMAVQRDWHQIREWYAGIFDTSLSSSEDIKAMAASLSDGLDDEEAVLAAIHEFVATEVRYVGLEHGSFAYVPRESDVTLKRRYGDCKDKTALLIDLLQQVGIQMSPVLVATSRRDPDQLRRPSGSYFDHLIVCGSLSNGKEYCLDSTHPYTGIDTVSDWIQGAVALPVAGEDGPIVLPPDDYQWAVEEELSLKLTRDGHLEESSTVVYPGVYGTIIRSILSSLDSGEIQDWALEDYQSTVSDSVSPDFRISGIDDINDSISVSWETFYENIVDTTQNLSYIEASPWLDQVAQSLIRDNTVYGYRFPGLMYDGKAEVSVSGRWDLDHAGPDIEIDTRFGTFRRTHTIKGQRVVIETSVRAPAAMIDVEEIPNLTRFLNVVAGESHLRVVGTLRDAD